MAVFDSYGVLAPSSAMVELPNPMGQEGTHRLHYLNWGEAKANTVIAVHGLTRNARDFGPLAGVLSAQHKVIAPDMPGRGQSAWLPDPVWYNYTTYLQDAFALLKVLGGAPVDWVGTSMGGLIGMMVAAASPVSIKRLVLNDIGPFIPASALKRIGDYVGAPQSFETLAAITAWMREIYKPFGITDENHWGYIAEHSVRRLDDGAYRLAYDPHIAHAFNRPDWTDPIDLWELWDKIPCPVLVIRGEQSDILTQETAEQMTQRGPKAKLLTIKGVGHAPALMDITQTEAIQRFLAI